MDKRACQGTNKANGQYQSGALPGIFMRDGFQFEVDQRPPALPATGKGRFPVDRRPRHQFPSLIGLGYRPALSRPLPYPTRAVRPPKQRKPLGCCRLLARGRHFRLSDLCHCGVIDLACSPARPAIDCGRATMSVSCMCENGHTRRHCEPCKRKRAFATV